MKLFSALHFPCIVSFLLVLLVNITCIAEQVYFVFQQFREKKKSKCSPNVLWFPHDVMAYRLTVNNFQSNMLSQSLLF